MSELDKLIAAERHRAATPSKAESKATWRRVEKSLAVGAPAPFDIPPAAAAIPAAKAATGVSATVKVVIASLLIGGGTVTAVAVQDGTEPESTVVAADESQPKPQKTQTPKPSPRGENAATPDDEEGSPEQPEPLVLEPQPPQAPLSKPRRPPRATSAKQAAAPAAASSATGFAEETKLITRAQAALRAGDAKKALAVLGQHRKRFPDGVLAEESSALRVIALCDAGRHGEAVSARKAFLARWPSSLHRSRVNKACDHSP